MWKQKCDLNYIPNSTFSFNVPCIVIGFFWRDNVFLFGVHVWSWDYCAPSFAHPSYAHRHSRAVIRMTSQLGPLP